MRIFKLLIIFLSMYVLAIGSIAAAAFSGYLTAQLLLAAMFYRGYGVPQIPKYSFYWYSKASEKSQLGKYFLGISYYEGIGTEVNYEKAVSLLKESAEAGVLNAQLALGNILSTSKHKNYSYVYYTMAANQGSEEAKKLITNLKKSMSEVEIYESEQLFKENCCHF